MLRSFYRTIYRDLLTSTVAGTLCVHVYSRYTIFCTCNYRLSNTSLSAPCTRWLMGQTNRNFRKFKKIENRNVCSLDSSNEPYKIIVTKFWEQQHSWKLKEKKRKLLLCNNPSTVLIHPSLRCKRRSKMPLTKKPAKWEIFFLPNWSLQIGKFLYLHCCVTMLPMTVLRLLQSFRFYIRQKKNGHKY